MSKFLTELTTQKSVQLIPYRGKPKIPETLRTSHLLVKSTNQWLGKDNNDAKKRLNGFNRFNKIQTVPEPKLFSSNPTRTETVLHQTVPEPYPNPNRFNRLQTG